MSLGSTVEAPATTDWWRSAVVYQLYIRSFADGNGDGIGDIAGIRARLDHLRDLGVDAVWINPWYPSPMADAGYDVSDYRAIEPVFGTSAEAAALIAEAHAARPARAAGHRAQPHLRPARLVPGRAGRRRAPPGRATCSGPAAATGRPTTGRASSAARPGPGWPTASWYLHLFDPGQPDLDWTNPEVRRRVRVGPAVLVRPGRRRVPHRRRARPGEGRGPARRRARRRRGDARARPPPRPPVLGPRRRARDLPRLAAGGRLLPGGRRCSSPRRGWARTSASPATCGPTSCTRAFNFPYLNAPWDAAELRAVIDESLSTYATIDAPATWVLSNHDVVRHVSRLGRPQAAGRHSLSALPPDRDARPRAGHPPGPRGRAADVRAARQRLRLPGRRAGPAGRSRTCRRPCCRTRPGGVPATPSAGGTAAACRCPWSGAAAAVRLLARRAPSRSPGCRSPRTSPR